MMVVVLVVVGGFGLGFVAVGAVVRDVGFMFRCCYRMVCLSVLLMM